MIIDVTMEKNKKYYIIKLSNNTVVKFEFDEQWNDETIQQILTVYEKLLVDIPIFKGVVIKEIKKDNF